jgi:hypothetical protein
MKLSGRTFSHKWRVAEALARQTPEWQLLEDTIINKVYNKRIRRKLDFVYRTFTVED